MLFSPIRPQASNLFKITKVFNPMDRFLMLNTHSPYFLNAIEVYAARYDVAEQCRYYMASMRQDVAAFENVTDHIELIYRKLASPLQELENERYRNA